MMYTVILTGFILCFSIDLAKTCDSMREVCPPESLTHVLVMIDCRLKFKLQDQEVFINKARQFYNRNVKGNDECLKARFVIETFTDTEIYIVDEFYETERVLQLKDLIHYCGQTLPIEMILNHLRLKRYTFEHILISNVTNNQTEFESILSRIKLEPEYQSRNITFHFESNRHELLNKGGKSISYLRSFENIHFERCSRDKYSLEHRYGKVQTSFYKTTESSCSSNEARTKCAGLEGYLVSIESLEEIDIIQNLTSTQKLNISNIHVGLRWDHKEHVRDLFLESNNPFWLKNTFEFNEDKKCFMWMLNESLEVQGTIDSIFQPLHCDDILNSSHILCECHDSKLSQEVFQHTSCEDWNEAAITTMNSAHTPDTLVALWMSVLSSTFSKYCKGCIHECHFSETNFEPQGCRENVNIFKNNILEKKQITDESQSLLIKYCLGKNDLLYIPYHLNMSSYDNFMECQSKIQDLLNNSCDTFISTKHLQSKTERSGNEKCLKSEVDMKIFQETTACPETVQYECLKYRDGCSNNAHLDRCENFICPKHFFKCPNSYCILYEHVGNDQPDCPFGEDELVYTNTACYSQMAFISLDICVPEDFISQIQENFTCSKPCPEGYRCLSNEINLHGNETRKLAYKMPAPVYSVLKSFLPLKFYINFPSLRLTEFNGSKCNVENFDKSFQFWRLSELLVLDLSSNRLDSSDTMTSFSKLINLKFLNLSDNTNLVIKSDFEFPKLLEEIYLSHTRISSLGLNVFKNLLNLKHLDLSYTQITKFQDMGLPAYFELKCLNIQGVVFTQIEKNVFQGLSIEIGLWTSDFKLCCSPILNPNISMYKCHSPVDVISSCKHLVGDVLKRNVIWVVGLLTLAGNGFVLVYTFIYNRKIFQKAYGHYGTGLAVSDFIMGLYLLIIASVDIYFQEEYFLEEIQWRKSRMCLLSGFLSTVSSETSTFFISLITLDRYLNVSILFGRNKFTKFWTWLSCTLSWFIGSLLALIPVLVSDWEIYSSNGLCLALPFSANLTKGWEFSFIVFVGGNFILFLLIAFGQFKIFFAIIQRKRSLTSLKLTFKRRSEELDIAKKLAFVAITDFLCWFPIGIIGILSWQGYFIDRDIYAWIAVFVLPVNSALNPLIYTLPAVYTKWNCKNLVLFNNSNQINRATLTETVLTDRLCLKNIQDTNHD